LVELVAFAALSEELELLHPPKIAVLEAMNAKQSHRSVLMVHLRISLGPPVIELSRLWTTKGMRRHDAPGSACAIL
jgi:hypothetical protein